MTDPRDLFVLPLDPLSRITGSCTLLHHPSTDTRFLVDCGAYQGEAKSADRNEAPFPFDPRKIKWVLLTHAHLDHCGRIPELVRQGFQGKVVCSNETMKLAKVILEDAAKLTQTTVPRINWQPISKLKLFNKPFILADNLFVFPLRTAHVLGALAFDIAAGKPGDQKRVIFSGDIGTNTRDEETQPLLRYRMTPNTTPNMMVIESTYGANNRSPDSAKARQQRLRNALSEGLRRGGPVIIPVFALQRAQDLLWDLHMVLAQNPGMFCDEPIYYEAPMSLRMHEVYRSALATDHISSSGKVRSQWLSKATCEQLGLDRHDADDLSIALELIEDLFHEGDQDSVSGYQESAETRVWKNFRASWSTSSPDVDYTAPAIVLATGGMCQGGPVQTWLAENLDREEATVLLTGYCSPYTVGGALLQLAKSPLHERELLQSGEIELRDVSIPLSEVRASIGRLKGWSGHADQKSLVDYVFQKNQNGEPRYPAEVWIQHGHDRSRRLLQEAIRERAAELGYSIKVVLPMQNTQGVNVNGGETISRERILGISDPSAPKVKRWLDDPEVASAVEGLLQALANAMKRSSGDR